MDDARFKDALATWCSGVAVVTARVDGLAYGLTVSSFASVSLDPPLVLVCIHNDNRFTDMVRTSGELTISVLAMGQEDVSGYFASRGRVPVEFMDHCEDLAVSGAMAHLSCTLHDTLLAGDHTVIVARVVEAATGEGEPLLYYRRAYRTVTG